ncbi:aa3-type cytochrome oxidase subunit II [Marmoricola sp. RAF53]|uniref:aa3-type cytochrome oxidase subunit II n=1 Tax=Marmoricola sp. RAF53 TaxID=3233059 RepID=UPI003F9CB90D
MGLQLPKRARKTALGAVAGASLLFLTGCSAEGRSQIERLAMPVPASKEAQHMYDLWHWSWLAAMLTGVVVWGLMGWVVVKYWRRSESEIPVQTRYNLPIEIFYTLAPVMMVIVFFFYTVQVQDDVLHAPKDLDKANAAAPLNVTVVGQQWSWTFNYTKGSDVVANEPVFEGGTTADAPTLWLVKDKPVSIDLYSPDVIHSFWVPSFLFKMDVIPGRQKDNHFTLTPDREGTFAGRCAELCGVYHSRMLFTVKVTDQASFDAHLRELKEQGNTGLALGGNDVNKVDGLDVDGDGGEQ